MMTYKVAICIPVVDEFYLLTTCLYQIRKHKHPDISETVYIVDQSPDFLSNLLTDFDQYNLNIVKIKAKKVDAGYPIDLVARQATEDYLVSLDVDAFPIHNGWLNVPIKLIEEFGFDMVGKQTRLQDAYAVQGKFFHLNNYYRICKTALAKQLSETVGFCRYDNRHLTNLKFNDNSGWKLSCDNGVVTQWYMDQLHLFGRQSTKLSLRLNRCIGSTKKMGLFGMVIDDLIFHLVFGYGKDWIPNWTINEDVYLGAGYRQFAYMCSYHQQDPDYLVHALLDAAQPTTHFNAVETWNENGHLVLNDNDPIIQRIDELKKI